MLRSHSQIRQISNRPVVSKWVNPADYSDHPDATFQVEKNIQSFQELTVKKKIFR
jgi:hypothetical protein